MRHDQPNSLLDLTDIPQWLTITRSVVNQLIPFSLQESLKTFDHEEMFEDTLTFLTDNAARNGLPTEASDWAQKFETEYSKHYTHIRAYHACRAYDGLESYKIHGIKKLSRPLLRKLAHSVFANHSSTEQINKVVAAYNIPPFEKSVYLFTDHIHPRKESCNHYLLSGSEILQALSIELGIHSRGILSSQGKPYLIECEIPIKHISKIFRQELWKKLITGHFKIVAGLPAPTSPPDFSIRVTEPVSPAAIKEYHLIEGKMKSYFLPH